MIGEFDLYPAELNKTDSILLKKAN